MQENNIKTTLVRVTALICAACMILLAFSLGNFLEFFVIPFSVLSANDCEVIAP